MATTSNETTQSFWTSPADSAAHTPAPVVPVAGKAITEKSFSLFTSHELVPKHAGPVSRNDTTPDWIFPLIVIIIASFAWLRAFYSKYFGQIISAFFNNNLANQVVRDENILVQRASVLLNIVFNLVAALLLYFMSIRFGWSPGSSFSGLNRYLFFTLVVSAAYTFKFLVLKICGYLFHLDKEMATYIFNIFLINNVLGICLLPLVAIIAFGLAAYTNMILYAAIILVAAAFLYRIGRGLAAGISSPVFSFYYLFLYLCTLEIAPLLMLVKILK